MREVLVIEAGHFDPVEVRKKMVALSKAARWFCIISCLIRLFCVAVRCRSVRRGRGRLLLFGEDNDSTSATGAEPLYITPKLGKTLDFSIDLFSFGSQM